MCIWINTINGIMQEDYGITSKSAKSTATESVYKSNIQSKKPVILFLASWKPGNTYGGHFVMAYKYVDYNGALWFKAYDGFGTNDKDSNRQTGWINRNWIENGIYMN